jgi:hypothetical protein
MKKTIDVAVMIGKLEDLIAQQKKEVNKQKLSK